MVIAVLLVFPSYLTWAVSSKMLWVHEIELGGPYRDPDINNELDVTPVTSGLISGSWSTAWNCCNSFQESMQSLSALVPLVLCVLASSTVSRLALAIQGTLTLLPIT